MTDQSVSDTPRKLSWGHHRFVPTEHHIAGWGARLLWGEVVDETMHGADGDTE